MRTRKEIYRDFRSFDGYPLLIDLYSLSMISDINEILALRREDRDE